MSHVTTVQTEVEFKDETILKEALQSLGQVDNVIKDYYGKSTNVDIAVHTPEFQRGIGFIRQGSQFVPQLDSYGFQRQSNILLNRIQQKYTQTAITKFYKNKRYSVRTKSTQEIVQIHARGY